ncbi:type I secretion protein [Thalassococcus sp. S3]|uniref:DUF6923 family protein n=1 Tax=Thalassococcus sp. S3 TaxID=2017482 RepID=UPI001024053A|nr:type I secretion protein [Thalassococcus sp. S3]QBF30831.1 type I secretion protein [Thalassococcus sp. S3]
MPVYQDITQRGSSLSDELTGTTGDDIITGGAGDDTITGGSGDDQLYGDYLSENLLDTEDGSQSFADYANSAAWTVIQLEGGHQQMTQSIQTEVGGIYEISLGLAANFAAGVTNAGIEVLVDGVVVATLTSNSGAFDTHALSFRADDTMTNLSIRSVEYIDPDAPVVDTSGPIYHYDQDVEIGGQTITVSAFAEGQPNLYQVLNGTLHVFETDTQSYQRAGAAGTVNVNSLGFNQEDNLLYAIAVGDGVDALGNAVSRSDLVMIDAEGLSYRIGSTPYRSWTGDFDDKGNLWSFDSSMDRITVIDVDARDADGNPVSTVHKLPRELVDLRIYDVAFDADSQTFSGVARPRAEGETTTLLTIDISGSEPVFTTIPVVQTRIDGVDQAGTPYITFGAAIYDADGNLFVGGNYGDHDMNEDTPKSGGIYRVLVDAATGTATLELVSAAPGSRSNDGAADPRAISPFTDIDLSSSVLVRDLKLVATDEGELTYDDSLSGEAGKDLITGGMGDDTATGGSMGDTLNGGTGRDELYGGAGPNGGKFHIISIYDENGVRYDQFGNQLTADDDALSGGAGDDFLSGSAGHDTLDGGDGDDIVSGGSGSDLMFGGAGQDDLSGGSQDDVLYGEAGNDVLNGGTGDDALSGGLGEDQLNGASGDDVLIGDAGSDTLDGQSGNDWLSGGIGEDVLNGGSGDDHLEGGAGDDRLNGGAGADDLSGEAGKDRLDGGSGDDILSGGEGADRLKGGSGNDLLSGDEGNDYLNGASGDDTLSGGGGKDRLYLGAGDDLASGGGGADRFVFRASDRDGGTNRITDFSAADGDVLDLRQLNVLDGGVDRDDWLADHLGKSADGSVTVDLDGVHVVLSGVTADTTQELSQLSDAFWF